MEELDPVPICPNLAVNSTEPTHVSTIDHPEDFCKRNFGVPFVLGHLFPSLPELEANQASIAVFYQ